MNNENAAVRLRQELKVLFKSGAITAEEYEAYQKRITYGIAIPVKLQSSASVSPPLVKLNEKRIIYPTRPETPPPTTKQNYYQEKSPTEAKSAWKEDWLLISLVILSVVCLISLLSYQFWDKPSSEQLTSKIRPGMKSMDLTREDKPAALTKTTTNQLDRIPVASTKSTVVKPSGPVSETAIPATQSTTNPPSFSEEGLLADKSQIISKALERLQAYYADMQATPLKAGNHFASRVERYYTLSNTTPAAISENINTYHFPEFLDGQSSIQEGSLKVVNKGNNSYELTYLEHGSAFRKSKNKKQETKAAVRVRFNPDFKITYFRQERLLENRFTKK